MSIKRKIQIFLFLGVLGTQIVIGFSIFELESDSITSNDERLIEIPLNKIGLENVDITSERSILALWDNIKWVEIPFMIVKEDNEMTRNNGVNLNNTSSLSDQTDNDQNRYLKFYVPYLKSTSCDETFWWSKATEYSLNKRIKMVLDSSMEYQLEIFFYFGNIDEPSLSKLPFLNLIYGSRPIGLTNNTTIGKASIKSLKTEIFELTGFSGIEVENQRNPLINQKIGSIQSTQTVYDRGQFFDYHEFRNTGWSEQIKEIYLPGQDIANGEQLIVSGSSFNDGHHRNLRIKFNNNWVLYDEVVSQSFYFAWDSATIHPLMRSATNKNKVTIVLTTYDYQDNFWRVDAYVNSYYSASEEMLDQTNSYLAKTGSEYLFKNTGYSRQHLSVDVPRGISGALLKIRGQAYGDSNSRIVRVYVDGALVKSGWAYGSFSYTINVLTESKYKDELHVEIVITTYTGYWLVTGELYTNARWDPFPDPGSSNMWTSFYNTFLGGSTLLWHNIQNVNRYFLGEFDYYIRAKRKDDMLNFYYGVNFHIPDEAIDQLKSWYCPIFIDYKGIYYWLDTQITCNGWPYGTVGQYPSYWGSPAGTGEHLEDMGPLLVDTIGDMFGPLCGPLGYVFPLLTDLVQWNSYFSKSSGTHDGATTGTGGEAAGISFDDIKQDSSGSFGRVGTFSVGMEPGTFTFTLTALLTVKIKTWQLFLGGYRYYTLVQDVPLFHETDIKIYAA